jgi:hypothetical protein
MSGRSRGGRARDFTRCAGDRRLDSVCDRRGLGRRRRHACPPLGATGEGREPATVARGPRDRAGEARRVADLEVSGVVRTQHAEVAGHARADHRRPGGERLGDDVRPAFHARGDDEHVRAPDRLAGPRVGTRAEPAHARIDGRRRAHVVRDRRVERAADDRERHGHVGRQQAPRRQRGARVLLVAQVAHEDRVQARRGLARPGDERPSRLHDDGRVRSPHGRQVPQRVLLQHDEPIRLRDRGERVRVAGRHVAIEIGAGQRDHERPVGMGALPARDRGAASARVQREHRDGSVARSAGHRRVGRL